jgi:hypothetical protein
LLTPCALKDERRTGGHVGEVFDEDRTAALQVVYNVGVVNDLVPHVIGAPN